MGRQSKEQLKAQRAAFYQANKVRLLAEQKAYQQKNKDKVNAKKIKWAEDNPEKVKEASNKLSNSEGYGVYKAVYPSGVYIGSGQIYRRRTHHLSGSCAIAKSLNEKATSFEVICVCNTKEDSFKEERKTIDMYGLANLLNTKSPQLGD